MVFSYSKCVLKALYHLNDYLNFQVCLSFRPSPTVQNVDFSIFSKKRFSCLNNQIRRTSLIKNILNFKHSKNEPKFDKPDSKSLKRYEKILWYYTHWGMKTHWTSSDPKTQRICLKTNLADLSMNHYLSNYLDFTQSAPHTNEYQFWPWICDPWTQHELKSE